MRRLSEERGASLDIVVVLDTRVRLRQTILASEQRLRCQELVLAAEEFLHEGCFLPNTSFDRYLKKGKWIHKPRQDPKVKMW